MKVCPMCGQENADEAIFCEVCQTNIRETPSAPRAAGEAAEAAIYVRICPACGAENPEAADRCGGCGAFLTTTERTRKNPETPVAPMKLTFASGAILIVANREQILGAKYQEGILGRDPYVSGSHLRLVWRGGQWLAEDISRNGTTKNGCPLRKGERTALQPGDRLKIGRTTFVAAWENTAAMVPREMPRCRAFQRL